MRIALIGCGKWGKNIARVLTNLEVLSAVVDITASQSKYVDSTIPYYGAEAIAWIRQQAYKIDAVVIATPSETHYENSGACRASWGCCKKIQGGLFYY